MEGGREGMLVHDLREGGVEWGGTGIETVAGGGGSGGSYGDGGMHGAGVVAAGRGVAKEMAVALVHVIRVAARPPVQAEGKRRRSKRTSNALNASVSPPYALPRVQVEARVPLPESLPIRKGCVEEGPTRRSFPRDGAAADKFSRRFVALHGMVEVSRE
jgi:hypothetical protein